jgi:uncharacterized protein
MSDGSGNGRRARTGLPLQVKCPQCNKPTPYEGNPWRPFCSERCKLIDLGQWAEGAYAIPAQEPPEGEEGEE